MKLSVYNDKGEKEFIEVDFWSFTKCLALTNLALTGIVYAVIGIFVLCVWLFGG